MKPSTKNAAPVDHYQILSVLFKRYSELAEKHASKLEGLAERCQSKSLVALCNEAIENGSTYPFDKMNRWLGFAQGVLAATGIIDVDAEREFTRPLLHQLHAQPIKSYPPKEQT
jgi:hypothetical protein